MPFSTKARMGAAGLNIFIPLPLGSRVNGIADAGVNDLDIAGLGAIHLAVTHLATINKLTSDLETVVEGRTATGVTSQNDGTKITRLANGNVCVAYLTSSGDDLYVVIFDDELDIVDEVQLSTSDSNSGGCGSDMTTIVEGDSGNIYILTGSNGHGSTGNACTFLFYLNSSLTLQKVVLTTNSANPGTPANNDCGGLAYMEGKLYCRYHDVTANDFALCEIHPTTLAIVDTGPIHDMRDAFHHHSQPIRIGTSFYEGSTNNVGTDSKFLRKYALSDLSFQAHVNPSLLGGGAATLPQFFRSDDCGFATDGISLFIAVPQELNNINIASGQHSPKISIFSADLTTSWDNFAIDVDSVQIAEGMVGCIYWQGRIFSTFQSSGASDTVFVALWDLTNTTEVNGTINSLLVAGKLQTGLSIGSNGGAASAGSAGSVGNTDITSDWSSVTVVPTWNNTAASFLGHVDLT